MKKYIKILKNSPLFYDIVEDDLLNLLKCLDARVEFFDKKYTVLREGSMAKYIGIVLSGSIQIISVDYFGNRNIIAEIHEAELFGEAFAAAKLEHIPVHIIANEPAEIMLIDISRILYTCSNACGFHQKLIFNLMNDLANKTLLFHSKLEITSKRTTREKLLAYLNHYSKKTNSEGFDIPFDRQELADYLGVDRSGLSVEIGKLKTEGIIECKKNHFKLL